MLMPNCCLKKHTHHKYIFELWLSKNAADGAVTSLTVLLWYLLCAILPILVEDLERNDGSTEKPYYMNRSLMKIMKVKNTQTSTQ